MRNIPNDGIPGKKIIDGIQRKSVKSDKLHKFDIKSLDLEQVASLCCVTEDKVQGWIDQGELRIHGQSSLKNIATGDLIDFLMQYNMPIPNIILPATAKKILFVFSTESTDSIYIKYIMFFFQQLRDDTDYICDYAPYGKEIDYKILTFTPDLIITDTIGAFNKSLHLNRRSKQIGGIRVLSIVENDSDLERMHEIVDSGADEIVTRYIKKDELREKINRLFV